MGKRSTEIDCLARLAEVAIPLDDILSFLVSEKIITMDQIKTVKSSSDHAKQVQHMLQELKQNDKIQLLEYSWTVLPVERINILIITDRNQREFSYNGG